MVGVVSFLARQLFQPVPQLCFQRFGHKDVPNRIFVLGRFQHQRRAAALALIGENAQNAVGIAALQGIFTHALQGFVDLHLAAPVCTVKVQVLGRDAENLARAQGTDECQVDSEVQHFILDGIQRLGDHLAAPDGTFLGIAFGRVTRDRAFVDQVPFGCVVERRAQNAVDLIQRCAGQKPRLLFFRQFLLCAVLVQPTGRFAQGFV